MRLIKIVCLIGILGGCQSNPISEIQQALEIKDAIESSGDINFAKLYESAEISDLQQPPPPFTEEHRSMQLPDNSETTIPKKIIKIAHLNLQVDALDSVKMRIDRALPGYQAYISQSNQSNYQGRTNIDMTIRVPAEKLDHLMSFLESQASYLHNKEVSSQDVTEEYVDVKGRIENKKKAEIRFREILAEAKNVEEILSVENHLRKVREEIDAAEGRLRYLSNQTALSTINLSFYQPNYLPAKAPGQSYFSELGQAFSGGWLFLQKLVVGVIYIWPVWFILLGVFWLIRRIRRKSQVRQKAI